MKLKKVVLTLKDSEKIVVPIFSDKARGFHLDPFKRGNGVQEIKLEYDVMTSIYSVKSAENYYLDKKNK